MAEAVNGTFQEHFPDNYGFRGDESLKDASFGERGLETMLVPLFAPEGTQVNFNYCIVYDPSMDPNLWFTRDCEDTGSEIHMRVSVGEHVYEGTLSIAPGTALDKRDFSVCSAFSRVKEVEDRLRTVYGSRNVFVNRNRGD